MLKIESTGKNIEQAIENGLSELKVTRDDVEIKIIEKGGLFKKAKVVLIVDEDVEKEIAKKQEKLQELEKEEEKEQTSENTNIIEEEKEEKQEEEKEIKELSEVAGGVIEFIKKYCELQGIDFAFNVEENQDVINVEINGDNVKSLIGYRGEGLNSLQYICNIYASKLNKNCPKVYINVGNFKEEREQSLIKLARRLASKVAKTKQSMKLEPMTAYERKIIHNALQGDSFVTTRSVGEEPKRCLVIELK